MKLCCMFENNEFDYDLLEEVEKNLYRCIKCGALYKAFKHNDKVLFIQVDNYLGKEYKGLPYIYMENKQPLYYESYYE